MQYCTVVQCVLTDVYDLSLALENVLFNNINTVQQYYIFAAVCTQQTVFVTASGTIRVVRYACDPLNPALLYVTTAHRLRCFADLSRLTSTCSPSKPKHLSGMGPVLVVLLLLPLVPQANGRCHWSRRPLLLVLARSAPPTDALLYSSGRSQGQALPPDFSFSSFPCAS